MKTTNLSQADLSRPDVRRRLQRASSIGLRLRVGAILVLAGLLASSFYSASSASQPGQANKNGSAQVAQSAAAALPQTMKLAEHLEPVSREMFNPVPLPVPTPAGPTVETFAGGCTIPKTSFAVGDIICVKVSGIPVSPFFPHPLLLGNANSTVIQSFDITSDPQTFSFQIDATSVIGGVTVDNRGSWQAVVINPFFYYPEASTTFTVADPANATADTAVATTVGPGTAQAGTAVTFELEVKNYGPDSAATVSLTNAIPANTTFVDFQQTGGPTFDCDPLPAVGASSGSTTCTISSLVWPSPAASFIATYQINPGTPLNTEIVNTAVVTSTTNDQNLLNNSTSDTATVVTPDGTACSFDCPYSDPEQYPNGLVVAATSPSGAVVTFASAVNVDGDCGAISASPSSGSQFPIGETTVTVSSGAGPSCTFKVTVVNTPDPTISCPVDKVVTDSDNSGFENVAVGAPTTTPSSGVTVVGRRSDDIPPVLDEDQNVITPGVIVPLTDPYPIGTTGITWTVTDSVGRSATCTQRIVVLAGEGRPGVTITCPANVSATAPSGSCEATVATGTPTTNPSDGDVEVAAQRSDGQALADPFPGGTTTITWTAHDTITNTSASCTQTVTVTVPGDTTPPTLTVPANISTTTSSCTDTIEELGDATATDSGACNNGQVTISRSGVPPGHVFPTGTTMVTYTATDGAGNTATGVQTVTVTESPAIPPTVTAPADVSVNTGPGATSCGAVVSNATLGTATASDNCPGVTVVRTGVPAGNNFPVGNTTVTYTATDKSGNTATDTQIVTVVDNTVPTITAPADSSASANASCQAPIPNYMTGSTTADNCGTPTLTQSPAPGTLVGKGPHTVTVTATDAAGNQKSDDVVFTVIDTTAPSITCPANILNVHTLPGTCSANVTPGTATASDNCSTPTVVGVRSDSQPLNALYPKGTTTITWTATDADGNQSSCIQTITVIDVEPPTISCQANIIADFNPAVNGAVVTYTAPVGSDNCPGAITTRTTGLASGSTFPTGTTTNTFVVTDASGNTASCSFKVTVALTSIIGLDSVTMTGSGYADSYSSAGGYPATKGSLANVLSNGTITMGNSAKVWGNVRSTRANVNMTGSAQVTGNATAGTTVTTSGSATVLGTRTNNALAPVMTLPAVPACGPPYSPNSGISGTYSYNASTGDLTLSGTNIATLANGNYCFHNVTLGNSAQLKVNGLVVIKLTGTLNTSGATSLNNTTQIPSNLQILSSYSGSNGVVLGNSTSVYALIYAPNTGLNLSGAAPLFGTFAGKTLIIGSSGAIHYDTQLKAIWPDIWALIF